MPTKKKKEVIEAEYEEKEVTKNSKANKDTVKKPKKEKNKIEEIKETQKAFFFPRLIAYILDMLIISVILTLIMLVVPQSNNYSKYLEEYKKVQTDFKAGEISSTEFINKSIEIVPDLDRSNVLTMIVEVVVLILYFVVFQCYNKGQTIGKKLMHIKVVSNDNSELNFNNYVMRSIIVNSLLVNIVVIGLVLFINKEIYFYTSYILQAIQSVLIIVSAFMMMYKKDGRGIQDYFAHTKVVMCEEE